MHQWTVSVGGRLTALDDLEGARLGALLALDRSVAHALTGLDLHQAGAPHHAGVEKHVLAAAVRRDEAEALGGVEPLDQALARIANRLAAAETATATAERPRRPRPEAAMIGAAALRGDRGLVIDLEQARDLAALLARRHLAVHGGALAHADGRRALD